jgi:hypothetical protein
LHSVVKGVDTHVFFYRRDSAEDRGDRKPTPHVPCLRTLSGTNEKGGSLSFSLLCAALSRKERGPALGMPKLRGPFQRIRPTLDRASCSPEKRVRDLWQNLGSRFSVLPFLRKSRPVIQPSG